VVAREFFYLGQSKRSLILLPSAQEMESIVFALAPKTKSLPNMTRFSSLGGIEELYLPEKPLFTF
jgi:hypothetical protein